MKNIKFRLFQKIANFAVKSSLKQKMLNICVENYELKILSQKFLSEFKLNYLIDFNVFYFCEKITNNLG